MRLTERHSETASVDCFHVQHVSASHFKLSLFKVIPAPSVRQTWCLINGNKVQRLVTQAASVSKRHKEENEVNEKFGTERENCPL